MIVGQRNEPRPSEKLFGALWSAVDPILWGPLDQFRSIDGKDIAKAMQNAAEDPVEKVKVYRWREMRALL